MGGIHNAKCCGTCIHLYVEVWREGMCTKHHEEVHITNVCDEYKSIDENTYDT